MNRRWLLAIVLAASLLAHPAAGQDGANLRGDSPQTRKRLAEAEQKLLAGKHADATDDLQRVLDEAGDDFVSVDGKQYRAARWLAHALLARLPDAALKNYQDRIDSPARKLLAAAKRTNDPAPIRELLDRYFVSRPAEEGLLFLGDVLFERGDFREAEATWRRLIPDGGADIVYPASRSDPAAVRARIILAIIFQNDLDRAVRELAVFRKRHPGAAGRFAGTMGPFAETLQRFLDRPPALAAPSNAGLDWPAFGGGPDRSGRVATRLSGEWPARPTWEVQLPSRERSESAPSGPPRRPPHAHPVIVKDHVFVTDGWNVRGFSLITGQPTKELVLGKPPQTREKPELDPCPTLSSWENRIYVRVGPGVIKPAGDKQRTSITCVLVVPQPDGSCTLKPQWRIESPHAEDGGDTVWEGAPLVSGRRLWTAFARFEGGRIVHGIACYDPSDSASAPERPIWTADVCDGAVAGSDGRARHELLTLAGRHVVFCSNTGAVVALDAATGRRAWGFRYPRARQSDAVHSPHPSPAVSSGGRLFVAPADGDRVFALDPETGAVLWQSGPAAGARILGVSSRRLIVAVDGPARGIRAWSVENGSSQFPEGWIQHDGTGILGYGQGFVTDDVIVWPTRAGLLFLRSEDGLPVADTRQSPVAERSGNYFGNVVYGGGVLVVVGPTSAWGYVSQARAFGPASAHSHRDPARLELERLIDRTESSIARGEPAAARSLLLEAARGSLPNSIRAWAVARVLLMTPLPAEEPRLPAEVMAAVAPEIRDEWLFGPDGVPITLGGLLDNLLGQAGTHASAEFCPKRCPREPAEAPTLGPGADIVRTLRLPPGSAPLPWLPGSPPRPPRLFVATAAELLAVSMARGEIGRFAAPAQFTSVAEITGGFVAAGPFVVAVYGADRAPQWVFRVPMPERLPSRSGEPYLFFGSESALPELSSFRLHGEWLFARLGERHLIAFDLRARRIAWVLGSDGLAGFRPIALPTARRIVPEFGVIGRSLLVQLSDGCRWVVDAESGRIMSASEASDRASAVPWSHAPAEVEPNTVAVPDGPGLVRMIDLGTGVEKWKHRVEGETSLAGASPRLAACGEALLLAVRRNHGVELDRIDPSDGRSLWTAGPAFLDADAVDLAHSDADSQHVILPVGDEVVAIAPETGRILWKAKLPETHGAGGWIVRIGRDCVIAVPERAVPRERVADVLGRMVGAIGDEPALERLPGLVMGTYDAWVARRVPVVLLDPETGRRLVRFDIPARGPSVTARFERGIAVVATGDRVVWLR
jgi:outer membrane protein assembly factor BamB